MARPEAHRSLVAKLGRTVRQRGRRRPLVLVNEAKAIAEPVWTTTGKISPLAQGAGGSLGRSENKLGEHDCLRTAELLINAGTDQELKSPRRGEGPQQIPWEILDPMGLPSLESGQKSDAVADPPSGSGVATSPPNGADGAVSPPDGLSAFIARVLDQLTLSAWLPAALFTASLAVLLQFRRQGSVDIPHAIRALTIDPVRVLVLIIPLLVIATVVIQAFSFEAIRTLEGYWRRRGLANLARTLMIRRHVHRKETIAKRRLRASEKAFYAAEPRMLRDGIPFPIVNAMKAQALELEELPPLTDVEFKELEEMDWRELCDAWRIARIDHLSNEENSYPPAISRTLPTKLGNLIRATEDRLENTDGDLQGFVLKRYAEAPRRVQMQHDQFRNRLEMYCTLVFASAALLVLTPITLLGSRIDAAAIAIISSGFAALSAASYLAAIASASGYCAALKRMDEAS